MPDGKGTWESTDFRDVNDCKSQVGASVARDEFISLLITFLLQIHFCMVLFTHYKNSHMVKSKGGCQPDAPTDVQMGSGVFGHVQVAGVNGSMDGDAHTRVQHAVDDEDLRRTQQMS